MTGNTISVGGESVDLSSGFSEDATYTPLDGVVTYLAADEEARNNLMYRCAEQNYNENYESSEDNIRICWLVLTTIVLLFALLSAIALEFIDLTRDKNIRAALNTVRI